MPYLSNGMIDKSTASIPRGGGKGGGGGGSTYTPPAPIVMSDPVSGKTFTQITDPANPGYRPDGMSAADQLNAEITQRQSDEKAASDKAAADKAAAATAAENSFQSNRQQAYDTSMQQVMRQFQLQGADPNAYMQSDITPALQRQFQSVKDLDPNPTAAFAPNLGDTIIGNVLSGRRTQATNSLNSIFTPTYAQNAISDDLVNQYKGTILDEQFNPLETQLQNAQKRGTLGGAGYQAALDALHQRRSAADATVTNLGQGIINTDRSGINDYISGARNDASNLALAGNFDPNMYSSGAQSKVQSDVNSFGGALRNAVGDTKFANLTDLLNAGGAVQGASDPSAMNPTGTPTTAAGGGPLSPSFVSEEELAKQKRGLGNTGAF